MNGGKKIHYFVMAIVICALIVVLSIYKNNKSIKIHLPPLFNTEYLDTTSLLGKPYVLNVFASWCSSCRQEHDTWLAVKGDINLYGINYVDRSAKAKKYLEIFKNPYIVTGLDQRGVTRDELNIIGLPQTFVIDKQGHIRLQIKGPVNLNKLNNKILPLYNQLIEE